MKQNKQPLSPKGNSSKQQILKTSLGVFIQFGYQGTSLSDLCQKTGFTKGALYHHFKDKDDLYRQALENFFTYESLPHWIEGDFPNLEQRIQAGFENIDHSKDWIHQKVGSSSDNAILQFYSFLYEATRIFPQYQEALDQYDEAKYQKLTQAFEKSQQAGEIRNDQDPYLLALELHALLQQLIYLRFVNPQIKKDPQILDKLFTQYFSRLKIGETCD